MIQNIVDLVFQDPTIKAFCDSQKLTQQQLITELLEFSSVASNPPINRFDMTLDYAKSMMNINFDTKFVDDGLHCIHCYGKCTTLNYPPHTYCGAVSKTIYCNNHRKKDRELEIKAYAVGKFDIKSYKDKRDVIRNNAARCYLKASGYNTKDLKSMATKRPLEVIIYKYNKDYFYDKTSGVILLKINNDLKREFRTVGIDRQYNQNIRKLGPSSIMELRDTRVIFDYDSLNADARNVLELD